MAALKRSAASLVGGIAVAAGVFALWFLVTRELGYTQTLVQVVGAVGAVVIGVWIRVADL